MTDRHPLPIAVLISGAGRSLKNLLDLVAAGKVPVDVRLVISSSASAGGLQIAEQAGVPTSVVNRSDYDSHDAYGAGIFSRCRTAGVELVVMAGFLKFAPVPDDFAGKVVNIHPSLLPAFGGQGMYGERVHQAVLDYGAKVTGVTIHFVDNEYDQGPIIWQQPVPVFDDDTAESLAARVFETEKEAYPHVLRMLAGGRVKLDGRRVTMTSPRRRAASEIDE
ncbi:Phosphoribosylglycinamide formyltransferase [Pirellulimonas nuda]|uniref:Phosphoribosylglycinamide formyltransferase n=1 Tax=Pirellulimonas nuda TaxID=2528009 RepID=A0A518DGP1_9BACT|nr:phosphoribosylglycinamide formyltransferase [Pirellulimonas nuda]QDU90639.1 Phosphoribosylglycinamide formyltransferase [Pirellulimonas nuda]